MVKRGGGKKERSNGEHSERRRRWEGVKEGRWVLGREGGRRLGGWRMGKETRMESNSGEYWLRSEAGSTRLPYLSDSERWEGGGWGEGS